MYLKYPQLWDGCVAAYRMDRPSGLTLFDQSENANHGTLTNMDLSDWQGGALDFAGNASGNYVKLAGTAKHEYPAFTLAAFIYRRTSSEVNNILTSHIHSFGSPISGVDLFTSSGDKLFLQLRLNNSCCQNLISAATLPTNTLLHCAGSWDGGTMRVFIGGLADTNTTSASGTNEVNRDFILGNNADQIAGGNDNFDVFDGLIQDVRIYNRCLPPHEIQLLALRPNIAYERRRPSYFFVGQSPSELSAYHYLQQMGAY